MKALRIFHWLFGAAVVALPCFFIWSHYRQQNEEKEIGRVEASQQAVGDALDNYRQVKGNYPDSLQALNFSGSAKAQADLQGMKYQLIQSGYELSSQISGYVITTRMNRTSNETHIMSRATRID